ncbi:MAG: SH3 domain-containing protein [Anaerolineales bacterium]|nr:SH3 domain-containing protein [Anaerolineales bacterium]
MGGPLNHPRPHAWLIVVLGLVAASVGCTRAPARDPLLSGWQDRAPAEGADSIPELPSLSPLIDYGVVLVAEGDTLPVREQAGSSGVEIARLLPDQRPVRVTGRSSLLGSSVWVEIGLPGGGTGWAPAIHLTEARTSDEVCSDPRVADTLQRFLRAGEAADLGALGGAVSPWRGVAIRLDGRGGEVHIAPGELATLLASAKPIDWQTRPEAGSDTTGSFAQAILQPLAKAVQSVPAVCGVLPAGQTAIAPAWPTEYANLNYLAFYTPAEPAGSEFGWDTWAVGFDYAGGDPYVAVIIRYQGEI